MGNPLFTEADPRRDPVGRPLPEGPGVGPSGSTLDHVNDRSLFGRPTSLFTGWSADPVDRPLPGSPESGLFSLLPSPIDGRSPSTFGRPTGRSLFGGPPEPEPIDDRPPFRRPAVGCLFGGGNARPARPGNVAESMAARAALAHRSRQVLNEASEEPEATPPEVLELQNEVRDLRRELADLRVRARIAEARYEVGERLIEAQRVAAHDAETLIEALTITTRNAEAGYEAAERIIDRIVPDYNRAMARLDELEPDLDSDSDSSISSLIGSDDEGGA